MMQATSIDNSATFKTCGFCGQMHGPRCPQVKALEYHPDGTIKRVEFMTAADYMAPVAPPSPPLPGSPCVHVTYGPARSNAWAS